MDQRGFQTLEDMHDYMILKWNQKVHKNDDIVIIGDFSIGKAKETEDILKQLNGRKFLVTGNHDKFLLDNKFDATLFKWIKPYAELNDNKRKVILSHYFIPTYNGQYRRDENGNAKTWMLYGHVHNTLDQKYIDDYCDKVKGSCRKAKGYESPQPVPMQAINCFCMFSDYTPLTLDEWIELEKTRREKFPYTKDYG